MRKLIVQQWTTVDNIVAEEDGGLSFVNVEPYPKSPEDIKSSVMAFIETVDTMILGANTYRMFVEYWPNASQEGEFAEKLNLLNKYVASTSLTTAPWGNYSAATIINNPVETLKDLKQQDGKDIVLWGSLTLMQTLLDAELVDEVQLRICPTTRGKGTYMFKDRRDMNLIDVQSFENGVVFVRYQMNKKTNRYKIMS